MKTNIPSKSLTLALSTILFTQIHFSSPAIAAPTAKPSNSKPSKPVVKKSTSAKPSATKSSESKTSASSSSASSKVSSYEQILKSVATMKKEKNSFCYSTQESNDVIGVNEEVQVRLASTTKLLTTNWAIQKWGPDYRMTTLVEYDTATKEAFISNEMDPFFGRTRMFLLISELNKQGIYEFSKIRFSKDFMIFLNVEDKGYEHSEVMERKGISAAKKAEVLKEMLDVSKWSAERRQYYTKVAASAKKIGIDMAPVKELRFKVGDVEFNEVRAAAMVPNSQTKKIFVSKGAAIKDYLKQINKFSMNYPADVMFLALGGATEFAKFMKQTYNADESQLKIAVGSGLYTTDKNGDNRFDGYATCDLMVTMIESMDKKMKSYGQDLSNIMMVGGQDQGTTYGLYAGTRMQGAVITKTGTLKNAITYAGELKTSKGPVYFGVFFQSGAMASARGARNKVVQKLFNDFGGPKPIKYSPLVFRPYDGGSILYPVDPSRNTPGNKRNLRLSMNEVSDSETTTADSDLNSDSTQSIVDNNNLDAQDPSQQAESVLQLADADAANFELLSDSGQL